MKTILGIDFGTTTTTMDFRKLVPTVLERWGNVKSVCSQAVWFEPQVKECYSVHIKEE